MKKPIKLLGSLFVCGILAVLTTTAEAACQKAYMLDFNVQKGAYELFINGVFVTRRTKSDTQVSGGRPLIPYYWIVKGKNTIRIDFFEKNKPAIGEFTVATGCKGQIKRDAPLVQAIFEKPGSKTISFDYTEDADAAHIRSQAKNSDGLKAAVKQLQTAVKNKDSAKVIAFHEPMIQDALANGISRKRIEGYLKFIVSSGGKVKLPSDLSIEPAMGGKIYVVLTKDKKAPVKVEKKQDGGSLTWRTGAYWGQFKGKWGIVQLYQP